MRLWATAGCLLVAGFAYALEVPPTPSSYLTDYAGLIPASQAAAVESRLESLEQRTGHQVLAVLFPSLEGEALEDFTIRCAEAWKVGRKGLDDGLVFFAFDSERRMRLEVGYGLEATIPDAIASRLLRDVVTPGFSKGDYGGGVMAFAEALEKVLSGEPLPASRSREREPPGAGILITFIVLMIVMGSLRRHVGRRGGRGGGWYSTWGGGGFGGFGGGGGFGGFGGGGFSGGGGSFGGGGASGSW